MSLIRFGKSQKDNPTPSSVSNRIDLYSKICATLIPLVTAAPFIPRNISDIVVYILGGVIILIQQIKPYYGVPVVAATVPTNIVDTIEDEPKKEDK